MICASFISINHHWQNVQFGYVLLLDRLQSFLFGYLRHIWKQWIGNNLKLFLQVNELRWQMLYKMSIE